ncbi:AhpD-like protein [Amylostereum chailletii]|nr:AhpD-like protein [Amylostereum chailletii]
MPEGNLSPAARVPYVFPEPGTNEIADTIRERRSGKPLIDLDGVLLNAPPIAAGWNELGRGIRNDTSLSTDLKEILILRVTVLNETAFVCQGLTELQIAALDYADHVTRNIRVPQPVFDRIRALVKSDREIVEVTATIAGYNFTTRILRPLNAAGLADTPVPVPVV